MRPGLVKIVLDLCAGSGEWSRPYAESGYHVVRIDPHGEGNIPADVRDLIAYEVTSRSRGLPWSQTPLWGPGPVHGILAAPPCTVFSFARNRHPPTKAEHRDALSVVDACVRLAVALRPTWWALENPLNKLRWYLGDPTWIFRQNEYGGGGGCKPTGLWGDFTPPLKLASPRERAPTWRTSRQNARPEHAITPAGFARAFFEANP